MSSTVEKAAGTQLGRDLSTLGEYTIADGAITGTLNYQEGWTEFNSSVENEQKGYYVALNVNPWEGNKFYIDRTTGKGKEVAFKGDGIAICWLGNDEAKAKTAQSIVIVYPDGTEDSLSLSGLAFNPANEDGQEDENG